VARTEIEDIVNTLLLTKSSFSSGDLTRKAGISRQAVHRYLSGMVVAGRLLREGGGRGSRYRAARPSFQRRYRRAGLSEDEVWSEAAALFPVLAKPRCRRVRVLLAYAFTELLNNAIDHSGSAHVDVELAVGGRPNVARVAIVDRGIGAFEKVRAARGLPSVIDAVQEISKGKLTTAPERHTGEGLFFTSKAADQFELEANGLVWKVDGVREDQAIVAAGAEQAGTSARFSIALATDRVLEDLFARYTHDLRFDTSRIVVKLFQYGTSFVSRSEAKRLLAGLEKFEHVVLDFRGVDGVGQGFADEVFRVWVRAHPEVRVTAENMNRPVTFMVERARRSE
jgi:anti-sigma regulatory factor (Ser/Thr protein kinase)